MLAAAVSRESRANFINVPIADLMESGVGDSEKKLAEIFRRAVQAAPAVLFLDEIQAVFSSREEAGSLGQKLISQLAVEMDRLATVEHVVVWHNIAACVFHCNTTA
jgi:transitional endoplasmic reticulum ATPase